MRVILRHLRGCSRPFFPSEPNGHGLGDLWTADDNRIADDLRFGRFPLLIGSGDLKAGERLERSEEKS